MLDRPRRLGQSWKPLLLYMDNCYNTAHVATCVVPSGRHPLSTSPAPKAARVGDMVGLDATLPACLQLLLLRLQQGRTLGRSCSGNRFHLERKRLSVHRYIFTAALLASRATVQRRGTKMQDLKAVAGRLRPAPCTGRRCAKSAKDFCCDAATIDFR